MEGPDLHMKNKLIIVMVGLPARGKSYITKKLCRYLNWLNYETKIFNVGDRRRIKQNNISTSLPHTLALNTSKKHEQEGCSASFFNFDNIAARKLREEVAMETLDELLDYLMGDQGSVAIFDATNTTVERRNAIIQKVRARTGNSLQVLFLESQCFDESLLKSNMRLKLSGPDYNDTEANVALNDFKERVRMYERKYVPIGKNEEDAGQSYCQMIDVGRKFVMHNIKGYLSTQAVHYLQHFNLCPRQIWLTRHGESLDDVAGRIGGNSNLSGLGIKYANALSKFIAHQRQNWDQNSVADNVTSPSVFLNSSSHKAGTESSFHVWTSHTRRSIQTAQGFNTSTYDIDHLYMLDELNTGMLDGLTREQIKDFYSGRSEKSPMDQPCRRFSGISRKGYLDVTNRLRAVILEVERLTDHVLIISGLAVTRTLLAYFRGLQRSKIADLSVPLGTLYLLEPKPYGIEYKEFLYNDAKDMFEVRPQENT